MPSNLKLPKIPGRTIVLLDETGVYALRAKVPAGENGRTVVLHGRPYRLSERPESEQDKFTALDFDAAVRFLPELEAVQLDPKSWLEETVRKESFPEATLRNFFRWWGNTVTLEALGLKELSWRHYAYPLTFKFAVVGDTPERITLEPDEEFSKMKERAKQDASAAAIFDLVQFTLDCIQTDLGRKGITCDIAAS